MPLDRLINLKELFMSLLVLIELLQIMVIDVVSCLHTYFLSIHA